MSRQQDPSLPEPPSDPAELEAFPRYRLEPQAPLFRVVLRQRQPWWFGSDGSGRFDLRPPSGTCYTSSDPLSALLEVIGPDRLGGAVSTRFLAERRLCRLSVPEARELADLGSRRAAGFGITHEIHTLVPYRLPQLWAARLAEAGAEGVRYFLRHDPAARAGFALFGPAGLREDWPAEPGEEIGPELEDRLEAECGVSVLEVPGARELVWVDDPS
ncbi:MAG TPA: RES family NAD+ phosphorylase [Thermoanaerobaculia bacterium]|nr:RES family NAD+ phosphorylase [Thermoanaerobaculia bacterium]